MWSSMSSNVYTVCVIMKTVRVAMGYRKSYDQKHWGLQWETVRITEGNH